MNTLTLHNHPDLFKTHLIALQQTEPYRCWFQYLLLCSECACIASLSLKSTSVFVFTIWRWCRTSTAALIYKCRVCSRPSETDSDLSTGTPKSCGGKPEWCEALGPSWCYDTQIIGTQPGAPWQAKADHRVSTAEPVGSPGSFAQHRASGG